MDKLLLANVNCQLKNIVRSCKISAVHKIYYTNFAYARVLGLNTISADHNGERSQTKKRYYHRDISILRRELSGIRHLLRRSLVAERQKPLTTGVRLASSSSQRNRGKEQQNDEDNDPLFSEKLWVALFAVNSILLLAFHFGIDLTQISWQEFKDDLLLKGKVKEVVHVDKSRPSGSKAPSEMIIIHLYPDVTFRGKKQSYWKQPVIELPYSGCFEERLLALENELGIPEGERLTVVNKPGIFKLEHIHTLGRFIQMIVYISCCVFGVMLLMRRFGPMSRFGPGVKEKTITPTKVDVVKGITFKDVAGLKEAKQEILEFVDYLKAPQRFKDLGAKTPKGALLLGPPGCGKTLIAKALAAESKVPFFNMAGSEFVEVIGGLGAQRVRELFKKARRQTPCIIYIDEIDAIGRKRSGNFDNEEEAQTLNQLLVEMDGMNTIDGVVMIAATNRADLLDSALLRPGRFDRHITIDPPTYIERVELFNLYLGKIKTCEPVSKFASQLAHLTPGMTGADIRNVCNESAIRAASQGRKSVTGEDLDMAIERVVAGVEKKSSTISVPEKKVVAYHESGHALVGWLLEHTDALLKVTIVPRTSAVLGFAQYKPSEQKLYNKEEIFERMCMALGGRVAEAIIFNSVTTGAQNDLEQVTKMAYNQIKHYGMSDCLGMLSFPDETEESEFALKPYSARLATLIDEEARGLVAKAYQHTEKVLTDNRDKLQLLATTLLERETLSYSDVEDLIGPPPYGPKKKMDIYPHFEGHIPTNGENGTPEKGDSAPKSETEKFIGNLSGRDSFM